MEGEREKEMEGERETRRKSDREKQNEKEIYAGEGRAQQKIILKNSDTRKKDTKIFFP